MKGTGGEPLTSAITAVRQCATYASAPARVANWYKRNLRIFANINRITEPGRDRVLVIIGAGHLKLLKEFAAHSVRLGGTVSAEHGLGKRKSSLLSLQYTPEQIEALYDDAYHTKHVDTIFKRVFGKA